MSRCPEYKNENLSITEHHGGKVGEFEVIGVEKVSGAGDLGREGPADPTFFPQIPL